MSEYKTGREVIQSDIDSAEERLTTMRRQLTLLPDELLDTEVTRARTGGGYGTHLYLDVTDVDPEVMGKLMGAIHKLNKSYYTFSSKTLWKKGWNAERIVFEGTVVDKQGEEDQYWGWVRLERKVALGDDCKRYKMRKTSEYEMVICGKPELDDETEILEVIE